MRIFCSRGLCLTTCFVIVAATSGPAPGETLTLGASADNTLYQSATGAVSNGAGSGMFAGRNSQPSDSIRRALVSFDIASLVPAGATINSAALRLWNSASNVENAEVSVHRALESWGEGTSVGGNGGGGGAPSTPGDATWIHRTFSDALWTTAGGTFAQAASAATTVGGVGWYEWSSSQLAADVQFMLDNPGANAGWILLGNESTNGTAKKFSTREYADPILRPVLVVDYTPVPGPGGLAAGVAALVAFAGTRRRQPETP